MDPLAAAMETVDTKLSPPEKPFYGENWQRKSESEIDQSNAVPFLKSAAKIAVQPSSRLMGALEAGGRELIKPSQLLESLRNPQEKLSPNPWIAQSQLQFNLLGDLPGRVLWDAPIAAGRELLGRGASNAVSEGYDKGRAFLSRELAKPAAYSQGLDPKQFSNNPSFQEISPSAKPNENFVDFLKMISYEVMRDPATWAMFGMGPLKSLSGKGKVMSQLGGGPKYARSGQAGELAYTKGLSFPGQGLQETLKQFELPPTSAKMNRPPDVGRKTLSQGNEPPIITRPPAGTQYPPEQMMPTLREDNPAPWIQGGQGQKWAQETQPGFEIPPAPPFGSKPIPIDMEQVIESSRRLPSGIPVEGRPWVSGQVPYGDWQTQAVMEILRKLTNVNL